MKVLAIETSCDETGVAIVEAAIRDGRITFETRGSALLSQAALHAPYGGVYPTLAKREHEKNLPVMLAEALAKTEPKIAIETIDAIAVTQGPGLEPALWTGIEFAKKLAVERNKPLLPVNHMEGHLVSSLVQNGSLQDVQFPVLALLISGGHTEFVLMKEWFQYEVIGQTLDDAVGEAFDKVARMLGLAYPGGPEISKLATQARTALAKSDARLPRPMLHSNSCEMSFSGLKTAALYALRDLGGAEKLSGEQRAAFAAEFEEAVADVLVAKARRALEETGAQTFVIGGGVAANRYLRERLQQLVLEEFPDAGFRLPELAITGDNAIMIGQAAALHLVLADWKLESPGDFRAVGNLSISATK